MSVLPSLAGFVLAVSLAIPARAADNFITLADGTLVTGQLLSCTDTELTGIVEPEGEERTYKREQLTPSSWYLVRTRTAGENAKSRLELAKFCLEHGLSGNAESEANKALAIDPALPGAAEVAKQARDAQAAVLLRIAKSQSARGNDKTALKVATQIVSEHATSPSAAEAQALLESIHAKRDAAAQMQAELAQPLSDAQIDKMRESDPRYQEVQKRLKSAHEATAKGFKDKGSSSSEKQFRQAIEADLHILGVCNRVLQDEKDQPVIVKRVTAFRDRMVDETVEAHINLAGFFAGRSSYPDATKVVNEGLASFPDNQRLKEYLKHIETLSALASSDRRVR